MKDKIIEFEVKMLEEKILVCISKKVDYLIKYFPDAGLAEYSDTANGLAFTAIHRDKSFRRVVWLEVWDKALLVHELYHIINQIFKDNGIDDDETGARLMEHLYRETVKRYKK